LATVAAILDALEVQAIGCSEIGDFVPSRVDARGGVSIRRKGGIGFDGDCRFRHKADVQADRKSGRFG